MYFSEGAPAERLEALEQLGFDAVVVGLDIGEGGENPLDAGLGGLGCRALIEAGGRDFSRVGCDDVSALVVAGNLFAGLRWRRLDTEDFGDGPGVRRLHFRQVLEDGLQLRVLCLAG